MDGTRSLVVNAAAYTPRYMKARVDDIFRSTSFNSGAKPRSRFASSDHGEEHGGKAQGTRTRKRPDLDSEVGGRGGVARGGDRASRGGGAADSSDGSARGLGAGSGAVVAAGSDGGFAGLCERMET